MSRHQAREICSVAERLDELPLCFEAFRSGRLCWDRLVLVCAFADEHEDANLASSAHLLSIGQLQQKRREAEQVSTEAIESASDARSFVFTPARNRAGYWIKSFLPVDDGLACRRTLELIADSAPRLPDSDYPPYRMLMADAFVQLCSERRASYASSSSSAADRATLVVQTTLEDLASASGTGDLDGRVRICADTLARLGCDSRIQTIYRDSLGNIRGIGRVSRSVPPWLERIIFKRDQTCRFPGCERRSWVQAHHIAEWTAHAGPTNTDNLLCLCGGHHRFVHEGGWKILGNANEAVDFVSPGGRLYSSGPPALRREILDEIPWVKASPMPPPQVFDDSA